LPSHSKRPSNSTYILKGLSNVSRVEKFWNRAPCFGSEGGVPSPLWAAAFPAEHKLPPFSSAGVSQPKLQTVGHLNNWAACRGPYQRHPSSQTQETCRLADLVSKLTSQKNRCADQCSTSRYCPAASWRINNLNSKPADSLKTYYTKLTECGKH